MQCRVRRELSAFNQEPFDLVVIGGGIFGAGVARDAALRGLRVALIEKGDFASGTSSRSSKLIHGGFRYLEQYAFGLVAEACRERRILQRIAPHLVQARPFLLPVYDGDRRSLTKVRLGMTLYDLLARYRNVAPHRALSLDETIEREPSLSRQGLRGAVRFHDCQEDDARFCLDNILHAVELGAVCANYCELTGFVTRQDHVLAVSVTDRLGGNQFEIPARAFVNAAGPWVETVANLTPFNGHRLTLSPTKGVHLLLPRLTQQHAVSFQSRRDGRILFVLPWGECSLVGTTDTDWTGDPGDAAATPQDIDYLLSEVRQLFPGQPVPVITTYAGVRPLLRSDATVPWRRSREHRVVRQGENLFSVAGGKYTTYRAVAEEVVNQLCRQPGRTAHTPLPQHRPVPSGQQIAETPAIYASDIAHACEYELAVTLSDVMWRRTGLALSRHGAAVAGVVAGLMAGHLGWDDAEQNRQLQQYLDGWKRGRP